MNRSPYNLTPRQRELLTAAVGAGYATHTLSLSGRQWWTAGALQFPDRVGQALYRKRLLLPDKDVTRARNLPHGSWAYVPTELGRDVAAGFSR